jgi:hypothetical protein
MSRSHGHRFANETLPDQLFDNPLAFARTLSNQRQGLQLLASAWDQAGALLPAVDRAQRSGLTATCEQRGAYVAIVISVPPPRELGDPCAIAIVGSGDGQTKFDHAQYFILELDRSAGTGDTRFLISLRTERDVSATPIGKGPPPDLRWFVDHVCELVARRQPPAPRIPQVPGWYYWHAFRGDEAMRAFLQANDFAQQLAVAQRMPVLLLPEMAEAADVFLTGGATSTGLRQFHAALRGDASFAPACHILATMLANTQSGAIPANLARAVAILALAREFGADLSQSYLLEAEIRKSLATAGIDVRKNYETAQKLVEMAGPQPVPGERRIARGSAAPTSGDPIWTSLFLDESELSHYQRTEDKRAEDTPPGAIHAGHVVWVGDERWPMWRIIDTRYLFPTGDAAERYLRRVMGLIGDGLPALPTAELADATIAFGGASPGRVPNTRHAAQSIVVRVGRMIAKLYVAEGPGAPLTGHVLEQAMLVPLAQRIVARSQYMLARYWLNVGRGTDAAMLFAQSPKPSMLAEYPILALPEFVNAMLTLGDGYMRSAQALWDLQTQLRGREWQTHREATAALVRTLLDDNASDSRVNAAQAQALVTEMRRLDADPIWAQLEAECRTRT